MSATCCAAPNAGAPDGNRDRLDPRYRTVLWAALVVNAAMFVTEIVAGAGAQSSALQADALDFLADAANYTISLFVLGATLRRRATAALVKGITMAGFGLWVVGRAAYHAVAATVPAPVVMTAVGIIALAANVGVAVLLYRYRAGDANMRSVWLCTRNDALGNVAVVLAAGGVFTTGHGWPDIVVAVAMAALALLGARQIVRQAVGELRHAATAPVAVPAEAAPAPVGSGHARRS